MYTHFTKEERGKHVLLFLHGWGCDGSFFVPIAQRLNCTTFMPDLWGFGKSDCPPDEGFCVEHYADKLYEFCLQNNLNNFTIVCHSFGCRVALVFCAKYPELCKKLIITGGAGLRRKSFVRWLKVRYYKFLKFLVRCKVLKSNALNKFGSQDFKNLQTTAMKNTFLKAINTDLSHYAKMVKCPTLLVWGKTDNQTPLWMAKRLNKLIRDSFLLQIEGGHFAYLENAVQFAGIVSAFCEQ